MTEQELQELSRKAAECLPDQLQAELGCVVGEEVSDSFDSPIKADGTVWRIPNERVWLHESTEACTEIMVRVLDSACYSSSYGTCISIEWKDSMIQCLEMATDHGNNPLLAFRICVLRALVALKE